LLRFLALEALGALVLFELGLRVVYGLGLGLERELYMSGSRTKYSHVENLPDLLRLTPNGFVPFRQEGDFVSNSKALRTSEYTTEKDAGTLRLLVFGDSFTYSSGGVAYRMLWHSRLGEELRARTGREVEVLSLGVPATGPDFALRLWDVEGSRLGADLVVLAFFVGNDFTDVGGYLADRAWMDMIARNVYAVRLVRNLHLMNKLEQSGLSTARAVVHDSGGYVLPESELRVDELGKTLSVETHERLTVNRMVVADEREVGRVARAVERVREVVGDIDRSVRATGGRLVVMAIPDEYQVDEALRRRSLARQGEDEAHYDLDRPQQILSGICSELGIPLVDLLPASRAWAAEAPLYLERDTHWNPRGNRLAAEELAEFLIENRLIGE
jgi:lysophospholipase L1-like esterase